MEGAFKDLEEFNDLIDVVIQKQANSVKQLYINPSDTPENDTYFNLILASKELNKIVIGIEQVRRYINTGFHSANIKKVADRKLFVSAFEEVERLFREANFDMYSLMDIFTDTPFIADEFKERFNNKEMYLPLKIVERERGAFG